MLQIFTIIAMSIVASADVFTLTLGQRDQYSATLTEIPTLSGSRIMFTKVPSIDDGIYVILSEDLRIKVGRIVENNCKENTQECIQSVRNLLINPQTDLESRGPAVFVLEVVALLAFVIAWIMGESKPIPDAWHIANHDLIQLSSAATASAIAYETSSGSTAITITRKPTATSITGSQTPSVSTMTDVANGHLPGDVEIYLSDDLAERINELVHRSLSGCSAGSDFKNKDGLQSRSDDYGPVICAAKQIIINTVHGAALGDLGMVEANPFPWTAEDAILGMAIAIQFAQGQAPDVGMNPARAEAFGTTAFALAVILRRDNRSLGRANRISEKDLQRKMASRMTTGMRTTTKTSTGTSTGARSTSTLECLAHCTMTGPIERCETTCPTMTSGQKATETNYAVRTVEVKPWAPAALEFQFPITPPKESCSLETDSGLPKSIFLHSYAEFCLQASKSLEPLSWTVTANGMKVSRRSPQQDIDKSPNFEGFEEYKITLTWSSNHLSGNGCSKSCEDSFQYLELSDCGKGGMDQTNMAPEAQVDVGCGSYSYKIAAPPKKARVTCKNHPLSAPKHESESYGARSVESAAKQWCSDNAGWNIEDQLDIYWRWPITELGVPDRSSFWTRVTRNRCEASEKIDKDECITAFMDGLEKCDYGNTATHGYAASIGCFDFEIDISGVTVLESPPWDEHPSFPAPEFVSGKNMGGVAYVPVCYPDGSQGRPITEYDLNKAIDAYCTDGAEIKGRLGHWYLYPPEGEPQFFDGTRTVTNLAMSVENINNGAAIPYDNMDWCKGYDWRMGKDDCTYGFRKILDICNYQKEIDFRAGKYTYRCVTYEMFHSNSNV